MNVIEFLNHFKADISTLNSQSDFEGYQKHHSNFHKVTLPFHILTKQSYFELSHKLIDEGNYSEYFEFSIFTTLGLFTNEDVTNFVVLFSKISKNLPKIANQIHLENALDYIYSLLDMLFHEGLYNIELSYVLSDLNNSLKITKKLDPNNYGELSLRVIQQFQTWK